MKVLASYNIKGGVGKTAAAVNLAYLFARDGARTLVWDLDPQGATSFYFRIKPKVKGGVRRLLSGRRDVTRAIRGTDYEGLDLLPADFSARHMDLLLHNSKKPRRRLKKLLKPLKKEYDRIILDCSPTISLVSEGIFEAADALVVPSIPTTLSFNTLGQLRRHLDKSGPAHLDVYPFFSMVDTRKSMHRAMCAAASDAPFEFLESRIPYSSQVEQMGERRAPLHTYAANSAPGRAYRDLGREISARL